MKGQRHFKNGQIRPECINAECHKPVSEEKKFKNGTIKHRHDCYRCHISSRTDLAAIHITQTKKSYCENVDGRIGFKCTTTIAHESQLHLDHIDGDRTNNIIENVQTLCAGCHAVKGKQNGDHHGFKYSARQHGTVESQEKIFTDNFIYSSMAGDM